MKIQKILFALLLLFPLFVRAQYPFEKHKALRYREYKDWKTTLDPKDSLPMIREIMIPGFDNDKTTLKIKQEFKLALPDSVEYSELTIFKNGREIKAFEVGTQSISEPLPVFTEDINGDGLNDIKLIFPNYGCGAFNYYCQAVLLFQKKDGDFDDVIYTDIFEEFANKPERDFNHDGNYEIITQTFQNFGKHNYWLFNIYDYKNGKLVNVNNIADYPIMIPLDSHNVSKKIPRKKMKEFEIKSPAE